MKLFAGGTNRSKLEPSDELQMLTDLKATINGRDKIVKPALRPAHMCRTGEIQETVKHVLRLASKPLSIARIHELVAQELGHPVLYDTIDNCLRRKNRKEPIFSRIGRGMYRLSS